MDRSPRWLRYVRFWGPDVDADVDEELRFHLEMRAREFERRGLSPADARRAARERFGDVERIGGALRAHDHRRERIRNRRELVNDLVQDLRFGLRALLRTPAFTAVALLTLALGIGATSAIFSVVNAIILRPLPYPDADRITMVWMDNRRQNIHDDIHSWPNYIDYRDQNTVFASMAGYVPVSRNLTGDDEPLRLAGVASTADLFRVLGVRPLLGRVFSAEEETDGRDAVVVLGHGLWTRRFGADPHIIGATIQLDGRARTVIGVMPKGFAFPTPSTEVWLPLVLPAETRSQRHSYFLYVVGRLRPGVPLTRARAEMRTIATRLEQQYPGNHGYGVNLVSLPEQVVGPTLRTALWLLLGAVAFVLVIACANVANLLLARAAAREREIGVRVALGASRTRLVRQLLTESVLLAVLGGIAGTFLAWGGLRILVALAPADVPRLDQVHLDPPVLGVTLVIAVLTGIAFGLVPALQTSHVALVESLREGGRGGTGGQRSQRLRRMLVAAQMALVVVLLTGAGLLLRSFVELQHVRLGFQPDHLLTMRLQLPFAKYKEDAQVIAFYDALIERVQALPGVRGTAAISDIFLTSTPNSTTVTVEGVPMTRELADEEVPLDAVTPDYFRVMGIRLIAGRTFTPRDRAGMPGVVIVNEHFARRFWPNESAVGKRFHYGSAEADTTKTPWLTVVGVVADMRRTGFDAPVRNESYLPLAQRATWRMTLVVRTATEPLALASAVRGAVRAVDHDQPVFDVQSMDQRLAGMVAQRRFSMALLGTFAALALVLAVVGVYGVTAYVVAQRTREIGLRLALGAQPETVVRMVVRQGMRVSAVGIAVGFAAALALTRLMASLLYGVSATDAMTFASVLATLALVTLLANWLPARRAARVDPVVALREE